LVDYKRLNRPFCRFQPQAKLLLRRCKKIGLKWDVRSPRWLLSTELSFVGRPLQIEVIPPGKPGLIHYRAVEYSPLQHGANCTIVALRLAAERAHGTCD